MLKNVKSILIVKKIFDYLRNNRKLKLIKYNKKILHNLNITKEDFQAYITLKEFNAKFSVNIEDINIKELNLMVADFKNEGLESISNIKFIYKWNIKY